MRYRIIRVLRLLEENMPYFDKRQVRGVYVEKVSAGGQLKSNESKTLTEKGVLYDGLNFER